MTLSDYVKRSSANSLKGRNIIISERIALGNSLLRKLNTQQGVDIYDTDTKTLLDIGKELVTAYGCVVNESLKVLSPDGEIYVLEGILKEKEYRTIDRRSLSMKTVQNILCCIRELGMNGTTEEWETAIQNDTKASELNEIKSRYEDYLIKHSLLDRTLLYRKGLEILDKLPFENRGICITLEFLLPWIKDANLGILSIMRRSPLEKEFTDKLINKAENASLTEIDVFGKNIEDLSFDDSLKADIYKSYGAANEVKTVVRMIADDPDKTPYGDIQLFYSDRTYLNYIRAAFESARIPYYISNGYSALELNLTQLLIALIASAREDFSYKLLGNAILNPAVTFMNVTEPGKDSVLLNPIKAYNDVTAEGIGWGRERYLNCIERLRKREEDTFSDPAATDREKERAVNNRFFAEFLEAYILTFVDEKGNPRSVKDIMIRLWNLVDIYSYKNNFDRAKLKEDYIRGAEDMEMLRDEDRTLSEKLDIIEEFMGSMNVNDEPDAASVVVTLIQNPEVIERKRVFFIGLSAGKLGVRANESPVLSDDEKKRYITGAEDPDSPVLLSSKENLERRESLYRSIALMDKGNLTFIYSMYDTVGLKDSSPSVLLMEIADKLGIPSEGIPDAEGYEIANRDVFVPDEAFREAVDKEVERLKAENIKAAESAGNQKAAAVQQTAAANPALRMSATGLQSFLSCPLNYYYQYIKHLRVYEQKDMTGYKWLSAFGKGNLFHYTAEKYLSEILPSDTKVYNDPQYKPVFDEKLLRQTVMEQALVVEETEPFASKAVRQREEEQSFEKMCIYFKHVIENWNKEASWVVIGCELPFNDMSYKGSDTNHPVNISFNGFIDRMDGYLEKTEEGENILHIRIIDYKTGKLQSKLNEVQEGVQVQHFIYGMAAIKFLNDNNAELARKFGVVGFDGYSIDEAAYDFPYEKETDFSLEVTKCFEEGRCVLEGTLQDLKIDFPYETVKWMDSVLGAYQAGQIDDISALCRKYVEENEKNVLCKYCDYVNICREYVGY